VAVAILTISRARAKQRGRGKRVPGPVREIGRSVSIVWFN
jgi:hypothetical protein